MLVAALIPDSLRARLIDATKDLRGVVLATRDWEHLRQVVRDEHVSVVVVDPLHDKTVALSEFAFMLRRWPAMPMVAYMQLTNNKSAQALLLLSQQGLREVIISPYEDTRVRISYTLRRAMASGLVTRVRNHLSERLALLPVDIASAIEELFERPHAYQSGDDLVVRSSMARSTLYLHLQHAKLGSPKKLFMAARVVHAAAYLRNHSPSIQEIADKLRYSNTDTLVLHIAHVLQVRPGQLRPIKANEGISNDEVVSRLLNWIRS